MMEKHNNNSEQTELKNLSEHLTRTAKRFPGKPALLYPVGMTYSELEQEVNRFAFGLEQTGFAPGTRTVLLVPPGPEFMILTFALMRIGAVLVMIDPGMGTKAMADTLAGVKPEAFIGISKAHLLRKLYPCAFKSVKICVTLGRRWFWRGFRLSDLRSGRTENYPVIPINPNSMAGIFFTSGSTGPAKGVVFTTSMLNAQIYYLKSHLNYNPEEIELCTFPLLGLFSLCLGLSLVIADMNTTRPATLDPRKVIANIHTYKCTFMFCSPIVLSRLDLFCRENKIKLLSIKRINAAGAPVPLKLLQSFKQFLSGDAEIHTPYGATEALPVTNIAGSELLELNRKNAGNQKGNCVGRPLEGLELKIIIITDDPIPFLENARELATGEVGEIIVKGEIVSSEYLNKPAANTLSKIENQKNGDIWHRMGDVGLLDESGRLWLYGRKSHRVEIPEQTLFTIPCEAVFNQHPGVFRSALVGVPVGAANKKTAVICIQTEGKISARNKKILVSELLEIGAANPMTRSIKTILFPKKFPVDPRHNAKIQREKLALWAADQKFDDKMNFVSTISPNGAR